MFWMHWGREKSLRRRRKNSFNAFNLHSFFVYIPFIISHSASVFPILILDSHLDCVRVMLSIFCCGLRQDPEFKFSSRRRKRGEKKEKQFNFLSNKQETLIIQFLMPCCLSSYWKWVFCVLWCEFNVTYEEFFWKIFEISQEIFKSPQKIERETEKASNSQVEKSQYCPLNTSSEAQNNPLRLRLQSFRFPFTRFFFGKIAMIIEQLK